MQTGKALTLSHGEHCNQAHVDGTLDEQAHVDGTLDEHKLLLVI